MIDFREDWPYVVIVSAIILVTTLLTLLAIRDSREWSKYANAHGCVEVGRKAGDLIPNGQGGFYVSADTIVYRCQGGEIVVR